MQDETMADKGANESKMLRFVLEIPADGLKNLVELLMPLAHVAYRSDLWLTERREGVKPSDNNVSETPNVAREPL